MTAWQLWGRLWQFDGRAWFAAVALVFLYLLCFRGHDWRKLGLFVAGTAVLLLAVASPIAVLADGTLFSAHVLQHVLLLLVVPPLWILSMPRVPRRTLRRTRGEAPTSVPQARARTTEGFAWPSLNWVAGLGVMWLWHLPALCVASLRSRPVFLLQVGSLLLAGLAFFWPVLRPNPARRLSAPTAIIYLFTACLACTLLGVFLTFSPLSACAAFSHPSPTAWGTQLRSEWGVTHALDQQVGGLVMWIPSCLIYLTIILVLTKRWFAEGPVMAPETQARGSAPRAR